MDCDKCRIGQTGRTLKWYKDQTLQAQKYSNKEDSADATHIHKRHERSSRKYYAANIFRNRRNSFNQRKISGYMHIISQRTWINWGTKCRIDSSAFDFRAGSGWIHRRHTFRTRAVTHRQYYGRRQSIHGEDRAFPSRYLHPVQ